MADVRHHQILQGLRAMCKNVNQSLESEFRINYVLRHPIILTHPINICLAHTQGNIFFLDTLEIMHTTFLSLTL